MLNQAATLEQGDLREIVAYVHAHEIAPQRASVALFATTTGNQTSFGFVAGTVTVVRTTIDRTTLAATLAASASTTATTTASTSVVRPTTAFTAVARRARSAVGTI